MINPTNPLRLILALAAGLVILYAGFSLALGTPHFLATVTSDSMTPSLERGDWVVLKTESLYSTNETIVFSLNAANVYVHRVVAVTFDGRYRTKGDANPYLDGWIVPKESVLGRVVLRIPRLGYLSLWLDGK